MILHFKIHEVAPYINWIYFFHAWDFQPRFATIADLHGCDSCRASWLTTFPENDRPKAAEAMQLFKEANRMLNLLDADFEVRSIFRLCKANSQDDNIILDDNTVLPFLRQQAKKQKDSPYLCLSDFIRPISSGVPDTIGIFATTVDKDMEHMYEKDPYKHLLVQTLADRLAEAATERMHELVRKEAWGYVPGEKLSIKEMQNENFQGIRPAVGYPSLPDQSINFILNDLLHMQKIGITLTENGAMHPHASVSGLMIAHPAARYFSIGNIGEDQLKDYAQRRGMHIEIMKKFLNANL